MAQNKAVAENFGLGVETSEMTMYRNIDNPGGNGMYLDFLKPKDEWESEPIKIIPLDKYFAENKLRPKDIKYIWIDTEGFEAQVLLGARNILTENPAPIFMEFSPRFWQQSGHYEKMMKLLTENYKGYILILETMRTKQIKVYPIEKLWEFQNSKEWIGAMGDIFLIHEVKK